MGICSWMYLLETWNSHHTQSQVFYCGWIPDSGSSTDQFWAIMLKNCPSELCIARTPAGLSSKCYAIHTYLAGWMNHKDLEILLQNEISSKDLREKGLIKINWIFFLANCFNICIIVKIVTKFAILRIP